MAKKTVDKHAKAQNKDKVKSKTSTQEKIKELEDLITNSQYNKRTQKAIGIYKAQLAKLKEKEETRRSSGRKGDGYSVRKSGDATVVLLGFPSVGKSTLLNGLTNANSPIAAYEFTTLDVIPGLLEHNHAKIQILDMPGIVQGAASGKGRGKEVLQVLRGADLIIIIIDIFRPHHYDIILKEIYDTHVRINQHKPDIRIKKTIKGGVRVGKTVKTDLDDETIASVLREFKLVNANVLLREDITVDQLIDLIEGNKAYIPAITVVNKIDMATPEMVSKVKKRIKPDLMISADKKTHLEELKDLIFKKLNFMRVYLKEVGKKADMEIPLIISINSSIKGVCLKLHKDFVEKFKFARVWGPSAKYDGQKFVRTNHIMKDKDVLELHIR